MAYTGTHSGYACLPTKSRTLSTFLSWDSQLLPLFAPVYALNRIASVLRVLPVVALRTCLPGTQGVWRGRGVYIGASAEIATAPERARLESHFISKQTS